MTYAGQIARILVSAPGDLGDADRGTILETVNAWNVREGATHGVAFVPMHWSADAAAEYGIRPQESINQQLVDRADVVIALFWTRLGTPTGEADSGTVEELTRAAEAGKYVAILRCQRPVAPSEVDTTQLDALEAFFESHRTSGLVKDYADEHDLAREIAIILHVAAGRAQADDAAPSHRRPDLRPAEVWATTDEEMETRQDSKGRIKNNRRHFILVTNHGEVPAHDVTLEFQGATDGPMMVGGLDVPITVLPPGAPMRFPVFLSAQGASSIDCTVRWFDEPGAEGGERVVREQVSTVRF